MSDYISTSQTITDFLKSEGIGEIEVDEFAPKVWHYKPPPEGAPDYDEGPLDWYDVGSHPMSGSGECVCPFYGPGGEGNLLKALRALEEKRDGFLHVGWWQEEIEASWRERGWVSALRGRGKTDGIALSDLLYKIATEEK